MAIVVIHSGQTGVERGVDRAARSIGFPVRGVATFERRDELGPLPETISVDLETCPQRGARSAQRASLAMAHALVVCLPSADHEDPSIASLMRVARRDRIPTRVALPTADLYEVATWVRELEKQHDPLYLMVSGPRQTRWADGEQLGRRLLVAISLALDEPDSRDAARASAVARDTSAVG